MNKLELSQADIDRQLGELAKKFAALSGSDARRAHSSALNKAAARIKSSVVRSAASQLGVSQRLLRPRLVVRKSNARTLESSVFAGLNGIPLIHLKAKEVAGGVQAGNYLVPDGFIAVPTKNPKQVTKGRTDPSGKLIGNAQVFKRKSGAAYPLEVQRLNVSPIVSKRLKATADRIMRHDMRKLMAHEYRYRVLKKAGIA